MLIFIQQVELAGNLNKERMIKYVIHYRDDSCSLMDSWFSYIVYHGRIYSYSSRSCYNYNFDKSNYREKGTLTKVSENVEKGRQAY